MLQIKDIFQKREKNKEESFGRKILRHRLTILYRSILIIAVLAAASVVVLMQMKNRVFGGYQIVSSVEKEKLTDSVTMALGENILTYSNDGASCINKRGEALWDQPYEMQSPLINICQNVVAIGD